MKKIIILGAGPTGLGAAYRLHKTGYKNWNIYEKNNYVGGLSASFRDKQGFTWDIGGHILFSNNDRFNRFVDDLSHHDMLTFKRESWIWLKDSFTKYPFQNNFHLHPDKEFVFECVSGLIDVLHKKGSYKNLGEWICHIFGEGIARYFMIPYNNKVWACPLSKMDYNWIAERVSVIDIRRILKNMNVIDNLKRCVEVMAPAGLVMVLEPLNPWKDHPGLFLTKIPQAFQNCRAISSPSCKILFDMYHQQITEGNIIPNIDRAWSEVGYMQIGDNPGRKEPTTGEMNYRNIFRHIHGKGFTGVLGIEHGNAKPGIDGEKALLEVYRYCDGF